MPEIYVVKLVTDSELLLNVGKEAGVVEDEIFEILDPNTQDVPDPFSGESLGSVDRVLAKVVVTEIGERMSVARVYSRRQNSLSAVSQVLSGAPNVVLNPAKWPEGVEPRFPARSTGRVLKSASELS